MSVIAPDHRHAERKQALISAAAAVAEPDQHQSSEQNTGTIVPHANDVAGFTAQFFRRAVGDEILRHTPESLADIVRSVAALAARRMPGERLISIKSQDLPDDKQKVTKGTVIELINDDMPFLVDTLTMILADAGLVIKQIIHPVLWVERDEKGELKQLLARNAEHGTPESMMHVEVEYIADQRRIERLEAKIATGFDAVKLAVDDWESMRNQVRSIAAQVHGYSPAPDADKDEAEAFLLWLAEDNFTLLGIREYEIVPVQGGTDRELRIVEGSGLGILRHQHKNQEPKRLKSLSSSARETEQRPESIIITKTNARSRIHRSGHMDYIGVLRYDSEGRVVGEYRIIGLFTSAAYNRMVVATPLLRKKVKDILSMSGLREVSHEGKALQHILETLPRDELWQSSSHDLYTLGMGVLDLQERPQTRLFVRKERFGRFYSCLVYIPRDRFNTENREKIQATLKRALRGEHLDFAVQVSESNLARLQLVIRPKKGIEEERVDTEALENRIIEIVRSWQDDLQATLIKRHGDSDGRDLAKRYKNCFPTAYTEWVSPWVASFDVDQLQALHDIEIAEQTDDSATSMVCNKPILTSLYVPRTKRMEGLLRFKLFKHGKPLHLSSVLPILENHGVKVANERPYKLDLRIDGGAWIQDFDLQPESGLTVDVPSIQDSFKDSFVRVLRGQAENDGFNRLVISANLHWRQITMLRAYCRYLLQTGMPFSQSYVEDTLVKHRLLSCLLVGLFEAQFSLDSQIAARMKALVRALKKMRAVRDADAIETALDAAIQQIIDDQGKDRTQQIKLIKVAVEAGLQGIRSQDEDRIIRNYYEVIMATLRTNFCKTDATGEPLDYLSFKLNSGRVPELPKPVPYREIWVHSARIEGVHLRGGAVARGGLRWSDRKEDFRTEVLGLMKAQNVKNTMIVPVGAKGGFVVKQLPTGDRETIAAEVQACYRRFINGLLDITDNLVDDAVVPPADVIRRDDDDTYLVVAADKGTATFSDLANEVAADHSFWLDDAFASGGSNGYDHKGMGITAKGAWESVKRHFREMGVDTQNDEFTVVGIGDMAGDVFGNGMLLSRHIRLQAAFNHLHIFLDPNPDAASSFAERERLFKLPRSSWTDYDLKRVSKGGGVFSRAAKSIPLSEEIREWLGIEAEQLTPQELIHQLLQAPVDLLWNGGIGTYVKASTESHSDAGDRVNNVLRVDAKQLRCKVVGEGGNLGLTQLGRIEYAQCGGRINTDFIDNSAGVDCSDHEVNIKILLDLAMREEQLTLKARNELLREMTDDVEHLVLRSNYLQTQAISMMEAFSSDRLGAKAHLISTLERRGLLDRQLEFLPDSEVLRERGNKNLGLTRPELSVLLSYSKISVYRQLLDSDVPEDPFLAQDLHDYFPAALQSRYADLMQKHPLKREIIATRVTNSIIDRMGSSFVSRIREDTGADAAAIAKAYTVVRDVFQAQQFWRELELLDVKVNPTKQMQALMEMWDVLRQSTRWLLNRPGADHINIRQLVDRFATGVIELSDKMPAVLSDNASRQLAAREADYLEAGFPAALAERVAKLPFTNTALDVVDEARLQGLAVADVLQTHFNIAAELQIDWLLQQVETLPTNGSWQAHARGHLRNDVAAQHRDLTGQFLTYQRVEDTATVNDWLESQHDRVQRTLTVIDDMRRLPEMDMAAMTVAVRSLEQLVNAGAEARHLGASDYDTE